MEISGDSPRAEPKQGVEDFRHSARMPGIHAASAVSMSMYHRESSIPPTVRNTSRRIVGPGIGRKFWTRRRQSNGSAGTKAPLRGTGQRQVPTFAPRSSMKYTACTYMTAPDRCSSHRRTAEQRPGSRISSTCSVESRSALASAAGKLGLGGPRRKVRAAVNSDRQSVGEAAGNLRAIIAIAAVDENNLNAGIVLIDY